MTERSVFISHSTKPPGEPKVEPAAGTGEHAEWARQEAVRVRAQVLFDLRQRTVTLLKEKDGFVPWVDDRELAAGGRWRDSIHEALLSAHGAVLLLTPEAQRSPWVLKEATVLTVFESVGFPVVIIPVFLGIRSREVEQGHWSPLKLRDLQAVRVDVDELAESHGGSQYGELLDEASGRVIAALEERLGKIEERPKGDPLRRWAGAVKEFISTDRDVLVTLMADLGLSESSVSPAQLAEALKIAEWEKPDPKDEVRRLVARELLLARDAGSVIDSLSNISDTPIRRGAITGALAAAWFPAEVAADIPITARRSNRVLVVNARNPKTGAAIVKRAYCNKIVPWRLIAKDEPKGTMDPQSVVDEYRNIVDGILAGGIAKLPDEATAEKPIYLIIGHQVTSNEEALDALLADDALNPVTFILLAGDEAVEVAQRIDAPLIEPPLPADADRGFEWYVGQLQQIGTGGAV